MSDGRSNLLMIILDDMGGWTMGTRGNHEIQTPNIDLLAKRGIDFANCYCVSPVCSPARASLLTGKIPSQHGVIDWIRQGSEDRGGDRPVEYLAGTRGFSDVLAENGYFCALIGKWHLGDSARPQKGFTYWTTMPKGSGSYYGARLYRGGKEEIVEGYLTDSLADEACEVLGACAGQEAPFFLSLNFSAPHRPWTRNEHPAEHWARYEGCTFTTCPTLPRHPWQINNGVYPGEDRNEMVHGYCTSLTAVDAAIGRVLDTLEREGLANDTLVVLTSDNGMSLGHHGIHGKGNATYPQNMYEQAVKVPFVMTHPGRLAPRVSDALISHYDFYPTLMEYLGFNGEVAADLPGRSFASYLQNADTVIWGHEEVVVFDEYGPVRMLRDQRWKFIWRMGDWPNELYDLLNDPGEENNLVGSAGHQEVAERLETKLKEWFARYVVPSRDASLQPVFGRGQVDRVENPQYHISRFSDDWFYQSSGKEDDGPTL